MKYSYLSTRHGGIWSGGVNPNILNLDTRWMRVVSFVHPQLYQWRKCLYYPLENRVGGLQIRD
jgi:hypothetical protein